MNSEKGGGGSDDVPPHHLTLNLAVGYTCRLTFVESLEFIYAKLSWISPMLFVVIREF